MREKEIHWKIAAALDKAEIKYRHNRRLKTGSRDDHPDEHRAFIDFLIIQNQKPALIVEVKKDSSTHAILTAIGQCVFYSDHLSLSRLGQEEPFPNAIICTPEMTELPGDLSYTIDRLGITWCWIDELPSIIARKLQSGQCMPLVKLPRNLTPIATSPASDL